MKPNDVAIRKRTQIAKANRTMFLWIAAASALVGAALVVSIFLGQKLFYNEKVLSAKAETVAVIEHNNEVVPVLEDEIRVLDADAALSTVKANENDQAIRVILDALPSEANSDALGASLQNKLLAGIDGLALESMQVDPVVGIETLTGDTTGAATTDSANTISFQFVVTGNERALRQALQNLERSIRTIKVTSTRIEIQSSGTSMTVQAQAFYEPAKNLVLTKEAVKQ